MGWGGVGMGVESGLPVQERNSFPANRAEVGSIGSLSILTSSHCHSLGHLGRHPDSVRPSASPWPWFLLQEHGGTHQERLTTIAFPYQLCRVALSAHHWA